MRAMLLALALFLAGGGIASAKCADEVREMMDRVEHQQKVKQTPQGGAAMKALQQAQLDAKQLAEVDCYNDLARARKALAAPAPTPANGTTRQR